MSAALVACSVVGSLIGLVLCLGAELGLAGLALGWFGGGCASATALVLKSLRA